MGFNDLPTINVDGETLLVDALIELKLASSKREAREFVKNNAVSVCGDKLNDIEAKLTKDMAIEQKFIPIRRGKKLWGLVKFN